MAGMEIFLIIVGITAIIGSFVFSKTLEKNDNTKENNSGVTEAMLEEQVSKAVDHILDDRIEETEAKMDRMSNEKIMAVGDYSDNVLKEIDKNHDEVMFLYSMLNEKEKEVKNTVKDVENIKRSINVISDSDRNDSAKNDKKMNENANNQINDNIKMQKENNAIVSENISDFIKEKNNENDNKLQRNNDKSPDKAAKTKETAKNSTNKKNKGVAIAHEDVKKNNNNKILELYEQGKSNIDIAKELNLGMGEVRLVIDLYKNKKR